MNLKPRDITAVLLAAGKGRRMAGNTPKLLRPWSDGKSILWHATRNAVALGLGEVVIVVRPDLPELAEAVEGLNARCVPNLRFREGMGTSIAAGIGALRDNAKAALVFLGDEPEVPSYVVASIINAHRVERQPITVPLYGKTVGPPTLFTRAVFPLLTQLEGDTGARHLIARHPELVTFVPFDRSDRPRDIDTERDLHVTGGE
jgi:CTP:molybdopterin cytidylyltransferase MocA